MRAEIFRVNDRAKKSGSRRPWLGTVRDRVRFEEGYLAGWFDSKRYYWPKREPRPRKVAK